MKLDLITYTPEPLAVIMGAAGLCYSSGNPAEVIAAMNGRTQAQKEAFIKQLYRSGHHSVFEHVSFTFGASGISRVTSHQLVRHRVASFSQQSQRYVRQTGADIIIPPSFDLEARHIFGAATRLSECVYHELLNRGVPEEDARYVLPHGCTTSIVFTMNARELLHFFELRLCRRAQWEIRGLAESMLSEACRVLPELFRHAGPPCYTRGKCPEPTSRSCGRPYVK